MKEISSSNVESLTPNENLETKIEESGILKTEEVNYDSLDKEQLDEGKTFRNIHTRNESLGGDKHPITGIDFNEKIIETETEKIEGVFPNFDSVYAHDLPKDLLEASDKAQFNDCNKNLKEDIENNPDLKNSFDEEQLEQIDNEDTPDGYTWHHNEDVGKVELVDSSIHAQTGHTGGKSIWGGGSENR